MLQTAILLVQKQNKVISTATKPFPFVKKQQLKVN